MQAPKPVQALLKWTPSGLGFFLTGHYLLSNSTSQAVFAAFFTGLTSLWVKFSDGFMQEAEQQAEKMGGSFAQWLFALLGTLSAAFWKQITQIWWEITSDFKGKYYQRLQYICRNFQTQGLEADQDRVLNLQQMFVPVRIAQRSLTQTSPDLMRTLQKNHGELLRKNEIGGFIALMGKHQEFRRLAILGAPGSGKTTLMRYLTLMYAYRKPRDLHPHAPQWIPALLYLREVYSQILQNNEISLADLLTSWVQNLQKTDPLKPPTGWFAKQLRRNRCLVLLDGLDEVADETQRQQISRWVDQQMKEYPETPFILTSRPLGYEKAQLAEPVTVLEVEPLDDEQIKQFIQNWYLNAEAKSYNGVDLGVREEARQQANRLIGEIQKQSALQELARNPLLLTMIATVHRRRATLPLNRLELYREICQVLLEKRQRAKGMTDVLTADQKQLVLQPLALDLTQRETLRFTPEEVYPLLGTVLNTLPGKPLSPEQFLKQLREVDALIAKEEEDVYEFAHRSFQEYLTATEIKETQQEWVLLKALERPVALEWWADTMRFYAAQTDATNLVQTVLKQPNLEKLLLAIDYWQTGRMQSKSKEALLAELNKPLAVLEGDTLAWAKDKQPRFFKLAYYLQHDNWRTADEETYRLMITTVGKEEGQWLEPEDLRTFPCEVLKAIDELWVKHSNGRFGFSVQKDIYEETGNPLDGECHKETQEKFGDLTGWRVNGSWRSYGDLIFSTDAPKGHLPVRVRSLGFGGNEWWYSLLLLSSLVYRLVNCSK